MKNIILSLFAAAALSIAQDSKPEEPKPLSEAVALKLENALLREQLAKQDKERLFTEVCAGFKLNAAIGECQIDLNQRVVKKAEAPAKPPEAADVKAVPAKK